MQTITLDQARRMFDGSVAKAQEFGKQMSVSIVDAGGHILLSGRMDGVPWAGVQMTESMAETVIAFGMTGTKLQRFNDFVWFNGVVLPGGRKAIGLEGGVAVLHEGTLIGAIACGGGTGEEDRLAAEAGIAAGL